MSTGKFNTDLFQELLGQRRSSSTYDEMEVAYERGHRDAAAETDHDEFVEALMTNIGEDWGAGEGSAESIVIDYVRALEKTVDLLGGHRGAYDGGQTPALGEFYRAARKHVTTDDVDDWNTMVDAWDAYVRVKAEAE